MIIRIWAFLTGGRLVWLRDHDETVTLSIAHKTQFGDLIAERYWPTNTRTVKLFPDGSVDGCYVEQWKDA